MRFLQARSAFALLTTLITHAAAQDIQNCNGPGQQQQVQTALNDAKRLVGEAARTMRANDEGFTPYFEVGDLGEVRRAYQSMAGVPGTFNFVLQCVDRTDTDCDNTRFASFAVADATPGDNKIVKVCPEFFTSPRARRSLPPSTPPPSRENTPEPSPSPGPDTGDKRLGSPGTEPDPKRPRPDAPPPGPAPAPPPAPPARPAAPRPGGRGGRRGGKLRVRQTTPSGPQPAQLAPAAPARGGRQKFQPRATDDFCGRRAGRRGEDLFTKNRLSDFETGGQTLIHELSHLDAFGRAAGLPEVDADGFRAHGTDDHDANPRRWKTSAQRRTAGLLTYQNAENLAAAATELFVRRVCQMPRNQIINI